MNTNHTFNMDKKCITAVLIGAGARGREAYGAWALKNKDKIRFVAVAEPNEARRTLFAKEHNIPVEMCFSDWKDLIAKGLLADACLVCTQDTMHTEPCMAALKMGYHVLLEKPMATTEKECKMLVEEAEKQNKHLRICHVLRYTDMFQITKKAIQDGLIGIMVNINHSENVAYWHFAHSYVRGHWRKAAESSPIILAKTCHDLDIIYWLVGSKVKSIQSFGTINVFKKQNKPDGAPHRCTDGCPYEKTCIWYAPNLYMNGKEMIKISLLADTWSAKFGGNLLLNHRNFLKGLSAIIPPLKGALEWNMWPATVITSDLSREGKIKALKEGRYGICVYDMDNDVPDHQTTNIMFENGVTATMTMQGLSYLDGRWFRIDGSKGSLIGQFTYAGEKLVYYDHLTLTEKILWQHPISFKAHGGGDEGLMESFVNTILENVPPNSQNDENLTSARASLESHLMGFAAEKSRLEHRVVDLKEVR
jgi:predicted dehydrogenase